MKTKSKTSPKKVKSSGIRVEPDEVGRGMVTDIFFMVVIGVIGILAYSYELYLVKKSVVDLETQLVRVVKAQVMTSVVEETKKFLTEIPPTDPYVIKVFNAYSYTKALDAALKQVKALTPSTSAMFFSVDEDAGKIFCLSSVPKEAIEKGLKANEWVDQISKIISGKGGGKADSAQASGSNFRALDEAIKVAEEFVKLKLSL